MACGIENGDMHEECDLGPLFSSSFFLSPSFTHQLSHSLGRSPSPCLSSPLFQSSSAFDPQEHNSAVTMSNVDDNKPVQVMIVGAGLGGVMLAILLERLNIPYMVFERSAEVRPLGKARNRACLFLEWQNTDPRMLTEHSFVPQ